MKKIKIRESITKEYTVKIDVFEVKVEVTKMRTDNLNYAYSAKVNGYMETSVSSDGSGYLPKNIEERAKKKAKEKMKEEEREEYEKEREMKITGAKDKGQENLFFQIK